MGIKFQNKVLSEDKKIIKDMLLNPLYKGYQTDVGFLVDVAFSEDDNTAIMIQNGIHTNGTLQQNAFNTRTIVPFWFSFTIMVNDEIQNDGRSYHAFINRYILTTHPYTREQYWQKIQTTGDPVTSYGPDNDQYNNPRKYTTKWDFTGLVTSGKVGQQHHYGGAGKKLFIFSKLKKMMKGGAKKKKPVAKKKKVVKKSKKVKKSVRGRKK